MRAGETHSHLSPALLAQWRLSRQPFTAPQDCGALYRNTALDMLANTVIQQLQSTDRIHIITGERGIGKSTFCLRLQCDAPEAIAIKQYNATRKSRINEILTSVLDSSGDTDEADTQSTAAAAAQAVFHRLRGGQQPVLLIDDAHLLNSAVLRMVLRFYHSIEKQHFGQLKLVLVSEKQIDHKLAELDNAAPEDERLQTHLIRPLNRAEIDDYVRFRFEQAGGDGSPLTERQLQALQKNTGGLPGRIETLVCRQLGGTGESPRRRQLILGAAGAAALGAAIGGAFFFTGEPPAPPAPAQTTIPSGQTPPDAGPPSASRQAPAETASPAVDQTSEPATAQTPQPGADGPAAETEPTDAPAAASPADAAPPAGDEPADQPEPAPARPPGDPAEPAALAQADAVPQATPVVPEPDEDAGAVPAPGATDPNPVEAAPDTEPAENAVELPVTDTTAEEGISRWPENSYAVQLAGAWSPDRLNAIAEEYKGEYDLVVHAVERNTDTWYILLYGTFPDRQSAKTATDALPPPLRDNRPWVRSIRSLLNP